MDADERRSVMRNRHDRSHGSLHGGSRRLLPILAFVAAAALSIQCDAKLSEFFRLIGEPVPGTGDIFGRVTVDGTARSGVAVTLRRNGLIVDSAREFVHIPPESIQPVPETLSGLSSKYLVGTAALGERLVLVLAIEEIVNLSAVAANA